MSIEICLLFPYIGVLVSIILSCINIVAGVLFLVTLFESQILVCRMEVYMYRKLSKQEMLIS